VVRAVAILGLVAGVAGCGAEPSRRAPATNAPIVAALVATPWGIVTGELTSGRIRAASGRILARVPVSTGGQRGLLGLAARGAQLYAASTARGSGRRIVVDRVLPSRRRVWTGPRSATLANGGHLAFAPDGRLVIGIGDRQSAARSGRC
jgi:glucose/arabinose dehydrogenase